MPNHANKADLIIAGGGLAGLLTAWRCLDTGNAQSVTVLEASAAAGGDHTWSFNKTDLTPEALDWFRPAIAHEWHGYDVHFPAYSRRLGLVYMSSNTASLMAALQPFINSNKLRLLTNARTSSLTATSATLENGDCMEASAVIDARGFRPDPNLLLGYQKFVGQTVRTIEPHGLELPVIMDATVPQSDGYRFVYCLPYSPYELLIEDTYYEDAAQLDDAAVISRIRDYALMKKWDIAEVIRTERGILPITLASDLEARLAYEADEAPKIGLAGALFNAVTGYSLPDAVRMAIQIGGLSNLSPENVSKTVIAYRRAHWEREKIFRLLNRMLFRAGKPEKRFKVLQRFYKLNEKLVTNFYRGNMSRAQKIRILAGKPPVPVAGAIYNLSEKKFLDRHRNSA